MRRSAPDTGALRRTLLAESLLLCGAGALLGVLSARPMVAILARYASRFSVRALDLTVDSSMLWVGAAAGAGRGGAPGVRPAAAVGRTRRTDQPGRPAACGSPAAPTRRLRAFAITQIAASFVLLAGASMLLKTLLALQAAQTGFDTRRVLAINVPVMSYGKTPEQIVELLQGSDPAHRASCRAWTRRARHARALARRRQLRTRVRSSRPTGTSARTGEEDPRGAVPHRVARILRGPRRPDDRRTRFQRRRPPRRRAGRHRQPEPGAAHVPESGRGQPPPDVDRSGDEVHRRQHRSRGASSASRRISTTRTWCPGPAMTVYHPFGQEQLWGGRLFVHARRNPYALVTPDHAHHPRHVRRTSRWNAPRRWKTSAPRCSRRTG